MANFTVQNAMDSIQARGWDVDTASEQVEMMNSVLRELYGERDWGFLEETSSHTLAVGNTSLFATNAAPANLTYQGVRYLHGRHPTDVNDRWELERVSPNEWRAARDDLETTLPSNRGRPMIWAWIDDIVRVHPAPDLAYPMELIYQGMPTTLVNVGDVIVLPEPYQDIVVAGVLVELALRERDFASADRWSAVYQRRHAELVRHDPNRYRRDRQEVRRTGVHDAYTDVTWRI